MSCGISPYLRQRLSRNSSQDNYVPLRRWGTSLRHAPFLFALWWWFLSCTPARSFRLASYPRSTCILSCLAAKLSLRTHDLWPTKLRAEPTRTESNSYLLSALEVMYALFADNRGFGITKLPCFTLWPRIFRKFALMSSSLNSARNNFSLRASSIGAIRVSTLGTGLSSYCH